MMFGGYNNYCSGNCYRMYNPVTSRVVITCNAIWLGRMYYTRQVSCTLDKKNACCFSSINMNECEVKDILESLKVVTRTAALATREREGTTNVSSEKSSNWVTTKTRFGCNVGKNSGTYNPATGTTVKWVNRVAAVNIDNPKNYNNVLGINEDDERVLEDSHNELIKFFHVGTGISGGFSNTQDF
jgi:hypothetical protein